MNRIFILVLILLNSAVAFSKNIESKTKYFNIIYDEKLSEQVKDFILNADKNSEKVFEFYNFNPKKKYNIIFRDNSDSDNGVTEYDTIKLYFNEVSFFYVDKNYDNWIDYLFVHELTHLVINQKSGGFIGKSLILKPILQQAFIPAWYQEGLAVYTESKLFKGGRGNSSRFKMYINAAINENEFDGFEFAGNYNINGNNAYIYGYSFMEYFAAVYGKEKFQKAIENFSKHQIRGPFYKEAGKNREELLKEWKKWVKESYLPGEGSLEGKEIVKNFGEKRNLKYYKNKIYFYSENFSKKDNNSKENRIFSLNLENNKIKKESGAKIVDGFELNSGKIYYSMIIPDFIRGNKRAATFKTEADSISEEYLDIKKAVNFFAVGDKIGVITRDGGKERAVVDKEEIISSDYRFKFEKFTYGNNNLYFSASTDKESGNYIYSYNINEKKVERITEGSSPFFFENNLYYSKNYKGIYNIYRIILSSKVVERVTDVKYGAFEPVVAEDGTIYYLNYTSKGYSIFKINKENKIEIKENVIIKTKKVEENSKEESQKIESKPFKDSFSFRNGVITNKNILLNFSNSFNERKIMLISGKIAYAGQKFKNYELFSEEKDEKIGVGALYIHSNGGIPLIILYGEKVAGKDEYISGSMNIPYFYRNKKLLLIGEFQLDSYGKKSAGVSLFGAAGYRVEMEGKDIRNELYIKTKKIKINYYFADKFTDFENQLSDGVVYNMKSSFKNIGYRFRTDEALIVRGDIGYDFNINKGSETGRTVINNIRVASDNIYAVWNNNGNRKDRVGVNLYIENNLYLNYNLNCKLRFGIIEQYDVGEKKILKDKEIPYIGLSLDI